MMQADKIEFILLKAGSVHMFTAYDERKENPRYELIRGEEKLLAQPATPHASVAKNIAFLLQSYLRGKRCKLFGEVDVFFDENNHFIPDLLVVCDPQKIKYNGIHGAPELIVEILSPGTAKNDRTSKKDVYEAFGVREYWLVNPKDKSVEVYHLLNGKFILDDIYHDYSEEDWDLLTEKEKAAQKFKVKVSLYDDLEIDVKEIFEDIG